MIGHLQGVERGEVNDRSSTGSGKGRGVRGKLEVRSARPALRHA